MAGNLNKIIRETDGSASPSHGSDVFPPQINRRNALLGLLAFSTGNGILKEIGAEEKEEKPMKGIVDIQKMTRLAVEQHVTNTMKVEKAGEILRHKRWGCVDGRCRECIVGTPGGDMGDLFLKLTAVEQVSKKPFTSSEAKAIFAKAIAARKEKFYMHTDTHALHRIGHKLHCSEDEVRQLLKNPGQHRKEFLALLTEAESIGCGHIFLLRTQKFPGAQQTLLLALLEAFYEALWEGKTELVILDGDHGEGAVAVFTSEMEITDDTEIPMPIPNDGKEQMFVHHQGLENLSDRHFAEDASKLTGRAVDQKTLIAKCAELHGAYTAITADVLAKSKGKPFYDVQFRGKGSPLHVKEIQ